MGWNFFKTLGNVAKGVIGIGGKVISKVPVLGGVGDAITSTLDDAAAQHAINDARAYNTAERIASQEYQTSEREAKQVYQTSEREAMQQYQTSERTAQNQWNEDMYNRYESPEAKVRQYDAAGLNPRMAASGQFNQVSSASNGGAPSTSAPSGGAMAPAYQDINTATQGFVNMSQLMKNLADAKLAGANTTRIETLLDDELKGLQLSNLNQELYNRVNEKYLDKEAAARLAYILKQTEFTDENINKIKADIDYLKKQGVLLDLDADWYIQKALATMGEQFANRKLAETREENERRYGGKVMLSEANRNNSAADLDRAQKKLLDYEDEINQAVKKHRIQDIKNKVNVYARNANIQIRIAESNARKALVEGKYPEFEYWWNKGMDLIDRGVDIFNSVKGFNVNMSQHNERLEERRREFDELMDFRWTERADRNARNPAPFPTPGFSSR